MRNGSLNKYNVHGANGSPYYSVVGCLMTISVLKYTNALGQRIGTRFFPFEIYFYVVVWFPFTTEKPATAHRSFVIS